MRSTYIYKMVCHLSGQWVWWWKLELVASVVELLGLHAAHLVWSTSLLTTCWQTRSSLLVWCPNSPDPISDHLTTCPPASQILTIYYTSISLSAYNLVLTWCPLAGAGNLPMVMVACQLWTKGLRLFFFLPPTITFFRCQCVYIYIFF